MKKLFTAVVLFLALISNAQETALNIGKNQGQKKLTKTGKIICFILDTIEKDHCRKSIDLNINFK